MRRALALALLSAALFPSLASAADDYRARLPQDEVIYFLLPDRFDNADPANDHGGLAGGKLATGFDPTDKAFYHGGDLAGVRRRLDYIQGLGATALWLAPVFVNKPVQGEPGQQSAGYHGYWITDFTRVDPHFGTNAEFKALVDAAHARGMKVYMDIVVNHTADVIRYRECPKNDCVYRGLGDYPFTRRGDAGGVSINAGFMGDDVQTPDNFARLTRPDFAYTPFVPAGEEHAKTPDWLNDPIYYHNRGDSVFRGESSTYGDFVGLDDLATEHPRVVAGFIEIFGRWIDDYGVDGFRIDTAQHVNPEFWQVFVPAIQARARARGIPNFHLFGEVSVGDVDAGRLARHTREDGLPAVLDFAFMNAAIGAIAGDKPTSLLARVFADDPLYAGGAVAATGLPTFLGNHDNGRFAYFVLKARPAIHDGELARRVLLGHALLLFARGVPTIYYGDEQGFTGTGDNQDSREDMFGSRVAQYNAERLVGTGATTATPRFDPAHPIYRALAEMARVRATDPALRRGLTKVRASGDTPGLFAFSRLLPGAGGETLVAINTSDAPVEANVLVRSTSLRWRTSMGACAPSAVAPGSYVVTLPPLGFAVCASPGTPK